MPSFCVTCSRAVGGSSALTRQEPYSATSTNSRLDFVSTTKVSPANHRSRVQRGAILRLDFNPDRAAGQIQFLTEALWQS